MSNQNEIEHLANQLYWNNVYLLNVRRRKELERAAANSTEFKPKNTDVIAPPRSFRILWQDETVRDGDEILQDDAVTWLSSKDRPLIVGDKAGGYHSIRRKISSENAADTEHVGATVAKTKDNKSDNSSSPHCSQCIHEMLIRADNLILRAIVMVDGWAEAEIWHNDVVKLQEALRDKK